MYGIVNTNFSRLYNPSCGHNALGDIKRLLTSRDPIAQSKACGYIIEVINRYDPNSDERTRTVEYLLDNDVTVFLCEVISSLDFSLFRSVLECIRLIWRERRFFVEENAALAMAAVVRALAHYIATDAFSAVDTCLHFICDLLNGIRFHETTSPLSHQSAYSTEQLLSCFRNLCNRICNKGVSILSSALVLHALISYQPDNLDIRGIVITSVVDVLNKWFDLLMNVLSHSVLVGNNDDLGMLLVVACQLGIESLKLTAILEKGKKPTDFVQKILKDEEEITLLDHGKVKIKIIVQKFITEIVIFVKDNQNIPNNEEYSMFLKFLLLFINENTNTNVLSDFCDTLLSKGYLKLLPQTQIMRNDVTVRNMSTMIIGEMLKVLAEKYLFVRDNDATCINDIQLGLVELQYGVERLQNIGQQLQKNQPYSLLIYIYFYCQSSEKPEELTALLLPFLVEHILRTPIKSRPPGYIIKALWLVFAMSTLSNGSLESLDQRVYLEKATDRLLTFLTPNPSIYYTHHPAILFWTFTSLRISYNMKLCVLTEWFKMENSLPEDFARESILWKLLLNVLLQNKDKIVMSNCMYALNSSLDDANDSIKEEFSSITWEMLPDVLSKALIDSEDVLATNITCLLDIATSHLPSHIEESISLKVAILITTLFSKTNPDSDSESRYHYEFVCLKLCLLLLRVSKDQSYNKVSLTYINRVSFLPRVLSAARSADDGVASMAVRLLTCIVYYFTRNNYEPKSVLEIQTDLIIKYLRQDSDNERGASLLQLIYMILNSGVNTPLVLTYHFSVGPSKARQCNALRALMFRVQLMLCSRDINKQSPAGWKTLSAIFKHAIVYKNDPQLVATLTSQPWTHILIRFQLTQNLTQEFLTFTQNWLTLLKITVKKNREVTKYHISRHSLISRTLVMLKKNLVGEDDLKDSRYKVLEIVNNILEYCQSRN